MPQGCIALGPMVRTADFGGPQSLLNKGVRDDITGSRTSCVRLWVSWNAHQKDKPPAGTSVAEQWRQISETPFAKDLDAQVAQGKAMGLTVILTSLSFPTWTNGTSTVPQKGPGYDPNLAYFPEDRFPSEAAMRAYKAGSGNDPKGLTLKWPYETGLGANSPWGTWMAYLNLRYGSLASPSRRVDFLEPINEPNYMLWPQDLASATGNKFDTNSEIVACISAQMFQTAQVAQRYWSGPVMLLPATADTELSDTRYHTKQSTYEAHLLTNLNSNGFIPDAGWAGRCTTTPTARTALKVRRRT